MVITYMPVIRWKQGEQRALAELSPEVRAQIVPIIELPPQPIDFEKKAFSKTLAEHLSDFDHKIADHWGTANFIVDDRGLPEEEVLGVHPLELLVGRALGAGAIAIPCTGNGRSIWQQACAALLARQNETSLAIRLIPADLMGLPQNLDDLLQRLKVERGFVDLIVDLEAIDPAQEGIAALTALHAFSTISRLEDFRSVCFLACAFPKNLMGLDPDSVTEIRRADFLAYLHIQKSSSTPILFGDYGVGHPDFADGELDPRMIQISASMRYTASDRWLVSKGRGVNEHGHQQMHEICRKLVARPEFYGEGYSAGDSWIARCARGEVGPGTSGTWRQVATNHHLTVTGNQLASRTGS